MTEHEIELIKHPSHGDNLLFTVQVSQNGQEYSFEITISGGLRVNWELDRREGHVTFYDESRNADLKRLARAIITRAGRPEAVSPTGYFFNPYNSSSNIETTINEIGSGSIDRFVAVKVFCSICNEIVDLHSIVWVPNTLMFEGVDPHNHLIKFLRRKEGDSWVIRSVQEAVDPNDNRGT